jgi:hypothetical protein
VASGSNTLSIDPKTFTFKTQSTSKRLADSIKFYSDVVFLHGDHTKPSAHAAVTTLVIVVKGADETLQLGVDESYQLDVDAPQATLTANSGTLPPQSLPVQSEMPS